MLSCINKNSKEFRDLLQASGLSENYVEAYCRYYSDTYGRFPYLDELPGANSEQYVVKSLKINNDGYTSIENVKNQTGESEISSINASLNNKYRDLEIEAVDIGDGLLKINIEHKPNGIDVTPQIELANTNQYLILDDVCDKLANLYGINIVPITNSEINENPELLNLKDAQIAKAFIYNNTIYINTDNSTMDSKIHELLHLLFSTMRNIDPNLYYKFIQRALNFDNFENIAKLYPNRTQGDLLEEVFVTELSKHLAGLSSSLDSLNNQEYYELNYQLTRLLDIIFQGEISSRSIPDRELFTLSFSEVGRMVDSPITKAKFLGSLDDTKIHRIMANTKSQLLKSKKLKEVCE